MKGVFFTFVAIVLIMVASATSAFGSHHLKCLPPHTTLYVYTFPVQKVCTVLTHNGKSIDAKTGLPFSGYDNYGR